MGCRSAKTHGPRGFLGEMKSIKIVFVSFRLFVMVVFGDLSSCCFSDVERRGLKQELTLHPSTLGFSDIMLMLIWVLLLDMA